MSVTPQPIYLQVSAALRRRIADGTWTPGEVIPSRRQLAAVFGVDLKTIQRAVAPLLADGTLRALNRRGGTVVADVGGPRPAPPSATPNLGPCLGIALGFHPYETDEGANQTWSLTILRAIEQEFINARGVTRIANLLEYAMPVEHSLREILRDARLQALVVIGIHDTAEVRARVTGVLAASAIPVAYITNAPLTAPVPHLFYDQGYTGYQAARHLLEMGYRRLIFFSPYATDWVAARYKGAQAALRDAGHPLELLCWYPPQRRTRYPHHQEHSLATETAAVARQCWATLIAPHLATPSGERPGIIAASDDIARHLMGALRMEGLHAGTHYGLISFDDMPFAASANLTSMRPPLADLGRLAAQMIMDGLRGEAMPPQVRAVSQLIRRMST